MSRRHHPDFRTVAILAAIPLAMTHAQAVQISATWNATNGNYAAAANWSTGVVPLNNGASSYLVNIGANRIVTYDIPNAQSIDGLSLGAGSSFNLQSSNALTPSSLSVLGVATIAGAINANGATFLATGAGTHFTGNATSVVATNGGVVRIAAPSFDSSGLANATVLNASGARSLIDLSSATSLSAATSSGYNEYVTATTGAKVDLSGITTIVAPASASALVFTVNSGASLDLSSLQTVSGPTAGTGYTNVSVDNATVKLGPLQSADRLNLAVADNGTLTAGGYAGSARLTNSTFSVASGGQLNAGALKGVLLDSGLANTQIITASGTGSQMNLSGLTTLDASTASGYNEYVTATTGAKIDLSGVTKLVAPTSGSALVFNVSTGAALNLSSLQTIVNPTGQVNFNIATGATALLHGLDVNSGVHFNVTDSGSTLAVAGNFNLLQGSTLAATAGTAVNVLGNFSFQQVVASQMNLDAATLALDGHGLQTLEVGGKDMGTPVAGTMVTGNFAIGSLDIGTADSATLVELLDAVNNGNRGSTGAAEALYLNGTSGGNGLSILGGSILDIEGLDVYAMQGGQWIKLNDLFQNGVTKIAYDKGYIETSAGAAAVPEPGVWMLMAGGLVTLTWRRRAGYSGRVK